jgi:hypothetical protein
MAKTYKKRIGKRNKSKMITMKRKKSKAKASFMFDAAKIHPASL